MKAAALIPAGEDQPNSEAKGLSAKTSEDYREIATKCRRLAECIRNDLIARGLRDLADEYEIKAVIDAQIDAAALSRLQPH